MLERQAVPLRPQRRVHGRQRSGQSLLRTDQRTRLLSPTPQPGARSSGARARAALLPVLGIDLRSSNCRNRPIRLVAIAQLQRQFRFAARQADLRGGEKYPPPTIVAAAAMPWRTVYAATIWMRSRDVNQDADSRRQRRTWGRIDPYVDVDWLTAVSGFDSCRGASCASK